MKNLKNALLLKQLYQLKEIGFAYTSVNSYKEEEPNLTLPNTLDTLKSQAMICHLCELSKQRNSVVFGEGSQSADLMLVGDAPSNSDDSMGKIFTGRAGEMLTKMLENVVQVPRDSVYITNLLKCKTHDTLELSPTYAHTCHPYLLKEIILVKPKIIVTFGESAYHYLSGDDTPLAKVRGHMVTMPEGYQLMPTYHPNYLLRNPSFKKEVLEDLKRVKTLL